MMIGNATEMAFGTGRIYLRSIVMHTRRNLFAGVVAIATCGLTAQAEESQLNGPDAFALPSYLADADASIATLNPTFQESTDAAGTTNDVSLNGADEKVSPNQSPSEESLRGAIESLSEDERLDLAEDPVADVERRSIFADRKTSYTDGKFVLPQIQALTTETNEIGNGQVPLGFRQGAQSPNIALPESGLERIQPWNWTAFHWAAPNTFSHPLYFEDRMLERHGHQRFPLAQPFVSGGRFMAQAFMLPYLGAINPPSECQYTLGYFRTGSCIHPYIQRPPYQRKAVASQATGIVSGIAILP